VEWNRTLVGQLAGRPLDDARVELALDDVAAVLRRDRARFDCILLDVDNGPSAMSPRNTGLYGAGGIALMRSALRPQGVAVIWSAGPDERFLRRLRAGGFEAQAQPSRAGRTGSAAHVLFVGALSASRRRAAR